MLKTLIIATVLLPTLALAQRSQQLPQPRQPCQWCPVGWTASGSYCVPGWSVFGGKGDMARHLTFTKLARRFCKSYSRSMRSRFALSCTAYRILARLAQSGEVLFDAQ